MSNKRLDSLFNSKIISHILTFKDSETGHDVGYTTLFLEEKKLAYYYYAFYDLNYYTYNLGMFMMTSAVDYFAQQHFDYIYLGTCYSGNALYKTQFSGFEFFNGFKWSNNTKELKQLIKRERAAITKHLIETPEFIDKYYNNDLEKLIKENGISIKV